jgi:hypothetical protein
MTSVEGEITVCSWGFWHCKETGLDAKELKALQRQLRSAVEWTVGTETGIDVTRELTVPETLAELLSNRAADLSILRIPPGDRGNGQRALDIRRILDAVYVYGRWDVPDGNDPVKLRGDWPVFSPDEQWLGEALVLAVECPVHLLPNAETAKPEAVRLLSPWIDASTVSSFVIPFAGGFLVLPQVKARTHAVLFHADDNNSRNAARDFLDFIGAELFLARLKLPVIRGDIELLWKRARVHERGVETLAQGFLGGEDKTNLAQLERLNQAVASAQLGLANDMREYEERLNTLRGNRHNLVLLFINPLLNTQRIAWESALLGDYDLTILQAEHDLGYFRATQALADRAQSTVNTLAALRAGFWNRAFTLALGLLAWVQIWQPLYDHAGKALCRWSPRTCIWFVDEWHADLWQFPLYCLVGGGLLWGLARWLGRRY